MAELLVNIGIIKYPTPPPLSIILFTSHIDLQKELYLLKGSG